VCYILNPDISDVIRSTPPGKNREMQVTDALQIHAQQGKVIGYPFKGRRFDCGSVDGFIDATNYTYKARSE
jgi:UTP--glucose-1-phosphate uridylyltransferase